MLIFRKSMSRVGSDVLIYTSCAFSTPSFLFTEGIRHVEIKIKLFSKNYSIAKVLVFKKVIIIRKIVQ